MLEAGLCKRSHRQAFHFAQGKAYQRSKVAAYDGRHDGNVPEKAID